MEIPRSVVRCFLGMTVLFDALTSLAKFQFPALARNDPEFDGAYIREPFPGKNLQEFFC